MASRQRDALLHGVEEELGVLLKEKESGKWRNTSSIDTYYYYYYYYYSYYYYSPG